MNELDVAPPADLFPRMLRLLGTVVAPGTPFSAIGSMHAPLARGRDPEAYEALWRQRLVTLGAPPALPPDGIVAFYAEWSHALWGSGRSIVMPPLRYSSGRYVAVSRSGWDFLLDAMRQGLWKPVPPTWAATAVSCGQTRIVLRPACERPPVDGKRGE